LPTNIATAAARPSLVRSHAVAATATDRIRGCREPHDEEARAQFDAFFDAHHRDLARLAYLLSGDPDAAEDLTAEALTEAWKRWDKVVRCDVPIAYVRRIVVNLAASRVRGLVRERRGWRLLSAVWSEPIEGPDVAANADVRAALARLPVRKRACVILRHYYGLSEQETAATLGISVGTVKSQTSRGVAELAALLGVRERGNARGRAGDSNGESGISDESANENGGER
jgi:RNA polymerase sigma-70 factor (sigma-E family)